MSRLCNFGLHDWTKWIYANRDCWSVLNGWHQRYSKSRECKDCGKEQTKAVFW